MAERTQGTRQTSVGVLVMAAALVLAAFLGGTAGLIWQSTAGDDGEAEEQVPTGESALS